MTDLQMLGNSFANLSWYRRTKDLVPLFDPKVHLFENSFLKIVAHMHRGALFLRETASIPGQQLASSD